MPRKKIPRTTLPDDLLQPIVRFEPAIAFPQQEVEINTEIERRFEILFLHYGVIPTESNSWEQLARSMAHDLLDGLKVVPFKAKGRPEKWGIIEYFLLAFTVLKNRRENNKSISAVCRYLLNDPFWNSLVPDTIVNRHECLKKEYGFAVKNPYVLDALEREANEKTSEAVWKFYKMLADVYLNKPWKPLQLTGFNIPTLPIT